MSEAPDRPPPLRRGQSPTESLSNFPDDHRLSPNDIVIPTPTDLDTTGSINDEEYLDPGFRTPTDLDTTESVVNVTNESVTFLEDLATKNDIKDISQRNIEPATPPGSEESEIDDSVADPDYEIPDQKRLRSESSDRTKSLSDEDVYVENKSPSVLDMEKYSNFDSSVNEHCRTSTPVFETTQNIPLDNLSRNNYINPSQSILQDQHISTGRTENHTIELEQNISLNNISRNNHTAQDIQTVNDINPSQSILQDQHISTGRIDNHTIELEQNISLNNISRNNHTAQDIQTVNDINPSQSILQEQHISTGRIDNHTIELEQINVPAAELNQQHNETVILNNTTENIHQPPREVEEIQIYGKNERTLIKQLEARSRQIEKLKSKHPICLDICTNCSNKCNDKFSEVDRRYIWNVFWNLSYTARRKWLAACVKPKAVVRRRVCNTGDNYRKKETRIYVLPKDDEQEKVCLSFFLKTLGYTSDSVIRELRKASRKAPLLSKVQENRGRKKNTKKCNYSLITAHINSFNPCVAHYRRYNAPNIRYMPVGITLKYLYSDFQSKNPNVCSRETYRKVLKDLGISLYTPESDVCADCAYYEKIKKDCQERGESIPEEEEVQYTLHSTKAKEATEEDNKDKDTEECRSLKIFTMDLEKVILLPNMPKVKEAFFVSRLVVFNETFAAIKPSRQNYCSIWHEGIAGRDAPQIIDSLFAFLRKERDVENFIIWCDNCSSQNKNWFLFTAMVTFVNSYVASRSIDSITFKYLTKSHTHMTADSIHGNIEQALKRKDTYDYKDFLETVEGSRRNLKVIKVEQFHKWQKKKRQPRRQNDVLQDLKLRDIVEVKFKRGSRKIMIKERFKDDYKEIDFLQKRFDESLVPEEENIPRGISKSKKDNIINKLVRLMPRNREKFWTDIPEKENLLDLQTEGQVTEESDD